MENAKMHFFLLVVVSLTSLLVEKFIFIKKLHPQFNLEIITNLYVEYINDTL